MSKRKYSSWDQSKVEEYVIIADRMLEKFNPNHKDNEWHPKELNFTTDNLDDDEYISYVSDFDKYAYQQWQQEQQQENDYE